MLLYFKGVFCLKKIVLFLIVTIIFSCAHQNNKEDNYPKYNDQVKAAYEKVLKDEVTPKEVALDKELMATPQDADEMLYPGYSFTLGHPSDDKLNGVFRSDYQGNIELPYNVVVNIKSKKLSEAKELVLAQYKKFFRRGHETIGFAIAAKEYWVQVLGLVKKPGRVLIKENESLDAVVLRAEGILGDLDNEYYLVTIKAESKAPQKLLLNQYFESGLELEKINWKGGETLFVSKVNDVELGNFSSFVNLVGGVNRPGKILFQKNASLFYYIDKAHGAVPGLSYEECFLFRSGKEGLKKIKFNLENPATYPEIMPGDTLYLNTQIRTNTDKIFERLTQIMSVVSTAAILILAL